MIKKLLFITFLLLGNISQQSVAQNLDKTKLDAYFVALEANNKFMGSVALSQNGNIIYTKAIGFIDVENKLKADNLSKYRIGSISKTFTSVLVFKAVEEKKLSLNQTIDSYFPDIKNAKNITISHLLNHRSGIFNFTNSPEYLSWNTVAKSEKEMVEIIKQGGSVFEPDSKAEYSNSNYVLLTFILEKTYKKPFSELLTEYICKPIGLQNTYLGGKIHSENNECKSYRFADSWKLEPETDTSIPLGAGGIVSTPSDLAKFSDALFGGKLLSSESLEMMKTLKDNYGMGLFQFPFDGKKAFGHTGGIDGFSSMFSHFSESSLSYALISNGSNYINNSISIAVLSAAFGKEFTIPEFKVYAVSSEDLDSYIGLYSSSQLPLKITISKDGKTLIAQATGQASFPLEATDKHIFKYDQAGLELEFKPEEKTMILKQGGGVFTFTKE